MKKYAFIGTHGAGKTTLVNTLAEMFYAEFPEQKLEIVREVARDCPFDISDKKSGKRGLEETYIWITLEQIQRELEAVATKPDYVLCDRCVLDPLFYYDGPTDDFLEFMHEMQNEWRHMSYDKIFLLHTSPNMQITDDNRRCLDVEFRDKINKCFMDYFGEPNNQNIFFIPSVELFSEQGPKLVKKIYAECFLAF